MPVELTKPTPSTVADKAAALTFLKSNYDWPKSVQFGSGADASNYTLVFVTNQTNGTIAMSVVKPHKDMSSEHYGTAYLDAMIMATMNESERTELVSSAASIVIDDHIKSKKLFIESQMQAIKQTVTSTAHDKLKMWQGKDPNTVENQQKSKGFAGTAFAGLLGAAGAIGASTVGSMGVGLGKGAVEANKVIQDLQNQQAGVMQHAMNPPIVKPVFVCPKCSKSWLGAAPQKCPACGCLVVSYTQQAIQDNLKKPYYSKGLIDILKANTKLKPGALVPITDLYDLAYTTGNKTVLPSNMPDSVKNAMKAKVKQAVADDGFTDISNDEQKFIQRVGVMSNLNVSIQGKKRIGITVYRLFCDKCKTPQDIEAGVITQRQIEDKVLVEFCNTHRHVSIVPQVGGERKFKDV